MVELEREERGERLEEKHREDKKKSIKYKKVTDSYSKVKAHLSGFQVMGLNVDEFNERQKAEYVNLPSGSYLLQHKKRKGAVVGSLERSSNITQRDIADKEAARMFYANALLFNVAKSPYFRQYSKTLGNNNLVGYTPPTYIRLRTTLLAQEKEHINRKLQPIRDSWRKTGVSIVSDGWLDRQRRPLINMMAASSGGAIMALSICNKYSKLSLLRIANTRDANVESKAHEGKQCIVNDQWWDSGSDHFNQPHVIEARMFEEPLSWWANYGASIPLLQALAFKLLHNRHLHLAERIRVQDWANKILGLIGDKADLDNHATVELAELSLNEPEL
ncbi:hypothetical protein FEM48_Zijuj01G0103300 [Ziziphus jujuba var. spinosa]|uniref:DUF659 domain-containing protein n=1 Tax=Ziziphus jujuba var. spinosa TaxID=714518 RepID=A0A978W0P4_ZIZJJ|nr:hypothetical protein FEM48_Zijuj01G0103300 [Ziziphus jujuba var. spinosa]